MGSQVKGGIADGSGVRRVRRWHRWLALVVGVQAVLWAVSGLYMTAIPIKTIHGDHLVRKAETEPLRLDDLGVTAAELRRRYGILTGLRLGRAPDGRGFLVVDHAKGRAVLDPLTGADLPPPGEEEIRRIAQALYTGAEPIADVALIEDIPGEIRGRRPPLWRVEFDHWDKPTFYLSPETGELLTRRHELWRAFDFLWMLHIMDYEEREDVNTWLLRAATVAGLLLAMVGAVLLALRLRTARGAGDAA